MKIIVDMNSRICQSACKKNEMRTIRIMLAWVVMYGLVACVPSPVHVTSIPIRTAEPVMALPSAIPVTLASPVPTLSLTQPPDVVMDALHPNQVIDLKLGQVLKIVPPNPDIEWQISFDPDLFELLTPSENVKKPGQAGWLFRALATGDGQIVLTSIVSCGKPPCPLMPMNFQLAVKVK
jgi:hypothetical protein